MRFIFNQHISQICSLCLKFKKRGHMEKHLKDDASLGTASSLEENVYSNPVILL